MTAPSNFKAVNTPMTARIIDESLVEMMRFVVHHYLDCNHKLGGTTNSSKPLSEVEQITGVNYGDIRYFLLRKLRRLSTVMDWRFLLLLPVKTRSMERKQNM